MVIRAQRTVGPLHFEDLEPQRFEDLVRQLAYGFRTWRHLDATGKLGRDEGTDIRGVETISAGSMEDDPLDENYSLSTPDEERRWLISCKRYREIGPRKMLDIVAETLTDQANPPYGFVLAAACDVSAETISIFRNESLARGAIEAHLWTKAHLEDMLFRPENDHLLFAYFDLSLTIRRRSQLQRIRDSIAIKRKLMRAFNMETISSSSYISLLIRDASDSSYPDSAQIANFSSLSSPPWHSAAIDHFEVRGIVVRRFRYSGWVREDGTWDILEPPKEPWGHLGSRHRGRTQTERIRQQELRNRWENEVEEQERATILGLGMIPFDLIVEVDPIGDTINEAPHLFCRFDGEDGPYIATKSGGTEVYVLHSSGYRRFQFLRPGDRNTLFSDLDRPIEEAEATSKNS